jgi:hypothetical protein
MNAQQKTAIGSVLTLIGATGITFSLIFGLTSLTSPWDFPLGFMLGLSAGVGVVLVIAGFLERRNLR